MKIPIKNVVVDPNRQRKDMGDLVELANSLKDIGLIQPIVLEDTTNLLLVGERRLRAAQYLGWDEIDFVTKSGLTPAQKKRAELEENTHRKDITWQERCLALAELHDLYRMDAHASGHEWYDKHTAGLTGFSAGTIYYNLKLASEIKKDPDGPVAKADCYTDAIRACLEPTVTEIRAEMDRRAAIAATAGVVASLASTNLGGPPIEVNEPNKIYLSSWVQNTTPQWQDFPDNYFYCALITSAVGPITELYRVMRPGAFIVDFGFDVRALFIEQPYQVCWNTIIGEKPEGWPFTQTIRYIRILVKGEAGCLTPGDTQLISAPYEEPLPYSVVEFLLQNLVAPPYSVFMVSGGPALSVAKMGLRPMLFEPDKERYDKVVAELKDYYASITPNCIFV
jgi:ParB family chromosome partitioning protein